MYGIVVQVDFHFHGKKRVVILLCYSVEFLLESGDYILDEQWLNLRETCQPPSGEYIVILRN